MTFCIALRLARAERSIERVVALVGRRGFEVVGVDAVLDGQGGHFVVKLTLESERSADVLLRQLGRLAEVEDVGYGDRPRRIPR